MPDATLPAAARTDEIYVGYLPVPPRQRRFLRWILPGVLAATCAATFLWARSQHSPGTGVWDQRQPVKLRGTLVARPYPILITDAEHGRSDVVLLVEMGKHGARHTAVDGQRVTVSGWPLHRDGRRMLELEPDDTAITPDADGTPGPVPEATPLGPVTLRGEIVDSKCFLGAMKPGEGKTHKECATLCIRGGVPPMLVTRDAVGNTSYILVAGPDGGPMEPDAYPYIGDPVEVTGEWSSWGDLRVLRLSAGNIRRL